ncbi:carboxymuconolactone decarboxylase family protein [Nocardioides sp. Soil796]|uniref:carboxymuconolactone decarboxylase family protein n=1 Tax=Nocardioides sp. Soil796 TaxID=1736412 RepID=UPI00070A2DB2|nr:carboxymuconolactone decarboxylase family protein [Nocardioides sp. Soil796]KRF11951.1 carboxymuconolactone decarboxylase [Nocardioides sp. Soil796]
MNGTTRIPRKPLDGIYGGILKFAMKKKMGSVPEGAEVMWHHPAIFKDSMKFGAKVEKWDKLDRTLATLAAMAAAAEIGCSFCLDFHYFLAHDKGLDESKAREVPRWRESDAFTPVERRVMEYAVAMCQLPVAVTDELAAALLEDLGAAGLLELTSRVGMMNMTARGNVALGIRSAEFAEACGLAPLAASSRPVVSAS